MTWKTLGPESIEIQQLGIMLPTIAIRRTRPGVKDLEQKYLPRNGWIFLKHDQSFWESYLVLVLLN